MVSIIIINYNTDFWVEKCIESVLFNSEGIDFEIILVDNNSENRRIEKIKDKFNSLIFIQLSSNIGFAGACNVASQKASGDFYFFLNPDTFLKNNAIKLLYDFWLQQEGQLPIACIGTQMHNSEGNEIHSFGQFPNALKLIGQKLKSIVFHLLHRQNSVELKKDSESILFSKVDYITGADLFISRLNFEQVSGFDNDYFMYFEETDLQKRLSKLGKSSYLIDGPQIEHAQGSSLLGNEKLKRVYYFKGLLLYCKKHFSKLTYVFFVIIWCFLDLKSVVQNISIKLNSATK